MGVVCVCVYVRALVLLSWLQGFGGIGLWSFSTVSAVGLMGSRSSSVRFRLYFAIRIRSSGHMALVCICSDFGLEGCRHSELGLGFRV